MNVLKNLIGACALAAAISNSAAAATLQDARAAFQNPLPKYSSGPLWVWNDLMTDEEVTSTLRDLRDQHVMMAFVHPRPGLMTPYMSDEWLRLYKVATDEAERLGMKLWIYDENSYPSGFAGGLVPDAMPDALQKGLGVKQAQLPEQVRTDTLAVFSLEGDKAIDVTARAKAGETFTTGTYLTINVETNSPSPWFGGKTYVDLLRREVVDKFLELTHEPYRKHLGDKYGKTILGTFTDEPNIRIHALAYTERTFDLFQKRWGYDLRPQLASLFAPVGDWKRVRHNYLQLLNEQFAETWGKTYYDYCEKHGLELTGHYWDHEWPNVLGVPDDMAMYAWEQRPSIDCLMNNYDEGTHGQFGNARMAREVSSVANQLGRERTLCETYGAAGWDLRFEDQKRIADWLAVLGINTFNQHLSYVTIRGARKRDHPQSFSYHAPYWQDYHVMGDYLARLSSVAAAGEQVNEILLFQPTTTAYIYQTGPNSAEPLKKLGDAFQNLHIALERAQVEYDIGSEYVMERWGSVDHGRLQIAKRRYNTVIIQTLNENLNSATLVLLKNLASTGGRVLCCGNLPSLVNGEPMDASTSASISGWSTMSDFDLLKAIDQLDDGRAPRSSVRWNPEKNGKLFHQTRKLADGNLTMLVNTSKEEPTRGQLFGTGPAEFWYLATGKVTAARGDATTTAGLEFTLPPCGSLVVAQGMVARGSAAVLNDAGTSTPVQPVGSMQIARKEPNVLTLDFLDLQVGDEVVTGSYFFKAAAKAFRKHGLNGDPWANAVQFKDEILKTSFTKQLPVSATYRFVIRDKVPQDLAIVVERPDLYDITCNGKPVAPSPEWWLDRAFRKLPIASLARPGDNEVRLATTRFGIYHELEPTYLVGSFSLENSEQGFVICPEKEMQLGEWTAQGAPMYGNAVGYAQHFTINTLETGTSYSVQLGKWYGSVARVLVNGKLVGHIGWAPLNCDVTSALRQGDNLVEVVVVGTLKNTLGPFHNGTKRGSAWPAMFQAGPNSGPPPGKSYDTIGYGMMEPFQLSETRSNLH
jgi:hypothetical protein